MKACNTLLCFILLLLSSFGASAQTYNTSNKYPGSICTNATGLNVTEWVQMTSTSGNTTTPLSSTAYEYYIQNTVTGDYYKIPNPINFAVSSVGITDSDGGTYRFTFADQGDIPSSSNPGAGKISGVLTINPPPIISVTPNNICSGASTPIKMTVTNPLNPTTKRGVKGDVWFYWSVPSATINNLSGTSEQTDQNVANGNVQNTGKYWARLSTGSDTYSESVTLTVGNAADYGSAVYQITPVTYEGGCKPSTASTVTIFAYGKPTVNTPLSDQTVCSGSNLNFTPTSLKTYPSTVSTTYYWTVANNTLGGTSLAKASSSTSITQNNLTTTGTTVSTLSYSVTPTLRFSDNQCDGDVQTLKVNIAPKPTISATDAKFDACGGDTDFTVKTSLDNNGLSKTISWGGNDNVSATNGNATATGVGTTAVDRTLPIATRLVNGGTTNITANLTNVIVTVGRVNGVGGCAADAIASFPITVKPTPDFSYTDPIKEYCDGETFPQLIIDSVPTGITVQWSNTIPGATVSSGTGVLPTGTATINPFTVANTNTDGTDKTGKIVMTADNGSCSNSKEIVVTVHPRPVVTVRPSSQSLCNGVNTSAITFTSVPTGTPSTFTWSRTDTGAANIGQGSGVISGTGNITSFTAQNTGKNNITANYKVTATVRIGTKDCATPSTGTTFSITVKPNPSVSIPTTSTLAICDGGTTNILLSSDLDAAITTLYDWKPLVGTTNVQGGSTKTGQAGPIIDKLTLAASASTAIQTLTYEITPTANGCTGAAIQQNVKVYPLPVPSASPATATICSGSDTNIVLTNNLSIGTTLYTWTTQPNGVTGASDKTAPGAASPIKQTLSLSGTAAGTVVYTIGAVTTHTISSTVNLSCASTATTTSTITVPAPPVITKDLEAKTYCNDTDVTLSISTNTASTDRYLWYTVGLPPPDTQLTDAGVYSGTSTNTLKITAMPENLSGTVYYVIVADGTCPLARTTSKKVALTAQFQSLSYLVNKTSINYGEKITYTLLGAPDGATFDWNFGDGWNSVEKSPVHYYYHAGTFQTKISVFVADSHCTKALSETTITVNKRSATDGGVITGIVPDEFSTYPNPVREQLSVSSSLPITAATALNTMGQAIPLTVSDGSVQRINTEALLPGLYVVELQHAQGSVRLKIIKE